tara:strand:- start:7319 stop:7465 length:147 start_codon:yes stop_codon:yes gene_type:complete
MVNVDIDEKLYDDIKQIVNKDRINFPSIRHYVHKVLLDGMKEESKEEE